MPTIKIHFARDRMGGVIAQPISNKWRHRFAAHMADMGQPRDASVYFQGGTDELTDCIPPQKLHELANDWPVVCHVDAWDFGHWLGYDAHTVAE